MVTGFAIRRQWCRDGLEFGYRRVSMARTFYDVLMLQPEADRDLVTVVYRHLAKRYHPDRDDSPEPSQFERRALTRITAGEDEVLERAESGVIRYVRPVRMERQCLVCHVERPEKWQVPLAGLAQANPQVRLKPGDVLAVISIEVMPEGEQAER